MTDSHKNVGSPAARIVRLIPLDQIDVQDRLRDVIDDYVQMLAESIRQNGLAAPIEVRPLPNGRFRLVTGGHRTAACMALGFSEIEAFVLDVSDLQARLREIDENLYRHELSAFDRGAFLSERKALWLELYPETAQGVAGGKARQKSANEIVSFAEKSALAAGYSRRTIEIAIAMYANLAPEARQRLRASPIARDQSELIRLSKLPPAEQVRVLDLMQSPDGPKKVAQAHAMVTGQRAMPPTATDKDFGQLVDRYSRAGARGRKAFIRWLLEAGDLDEIAPELLARRTSETA